MTDPLLRRIAADAARHAAPWPGEPVLAMVSGGADSLLLMHALAVLHDGPVAVLTVDHGLRPAAVDECRAVMAAAADLGLPARTVRLRLAPGSAVQARAREARLAAAREAASGAGCSAIALGHTGTDQAETVLMRLARGSGRTGALGMAPRAGDLVRPLLGVSAAEARDWCAARGLTPAQDPSNDDLTHTRVRARALLEALEGLHPGAAGHLAAFSGALRDEAEVLDAVAGDAWDRCRSADGLDAQALEAQLPALRRLLVRRLLREAGLGGDALESRAVDRVLGLLGGAPRAEVAGGAVVRERGVLRVETVPREAPPAPAVLPVPGIVRFGEVALRARPGTGGSPRPDRVALRACGPLAVRAPRPGDRIALERGGRAAVGRLLAARGVPARLRPWVPVVTSGDRPVWVAGHRADAAVLAAPGEPAVVLELVAP